MSFAIWNEPPPFTFEEADPEQIYKVGDKWVVTDDPAKATQEQIDVVRNAPVVKALTVEGLAELLKSKGQLSDADIEAAKL